MRSRSQKYDIIDMDTTILSIYKIVFQYDDG